jgi:hypothetical protein
VQFSAVYADADNDAPVQAEVWIDMNGDGRFAPDAARGERLPMEWSGEEYSRGVTFHCAVPRSAIQDPTAVRYMFRFADAHWYPPQTGGLVAGRTAGITYAHWTLVLSGGVPTPRPPSRFRLQTRE